MAREGPYPQDLQELVEEGFGPGALVNIYWYKPDGSLRRLSTNIQISHVDEMGFTHIPTDSTVDEQWGPHAQVVRGRGAYGWGSTGFDSIARGWRNIEVLRPGAQIRRR